MVIRRTKRFIKVNRIIVGNASAEEVLVITRHTKTVRAVEMKTGGEK